MTQPEDFDVDRNGQDPDATGSGPVDQWDGRDERVAKYERHLHTLLTSTLHELERLQARRGGEAVPPPVVADVNLTVDAGPA